MRELTTKHGNAIIEVIKAIATAVDKGRDLYDKAYTMTCRSYDAGDIESQR